MRKSDFDRIAPELRPAGLLEGTLLPRFRADRIAREQALCRKVLQGRWLGKHTDCREVLIPREGRAPLRALVITKKGKSIPGVGLLWLHGGGYGIGLPEQCFGSLDRLCGLGNATALVPDYTLSFEAPYPAALSDARLALRFLRAHAEELCFYEDQIFVGGESAGGGLTAALTLSLRENPEAAVAYQMPFYPMLDDRMNTPSMRDNRMPVWNTHDNIEGWRAYLGELFQSDSVPALAAPAREKDLSGLPPACTFIGDLDPFYDETCSYAARLRACGVPVDFEVFPGCFHAFDMTVPSSKQAKEAAEFYLESFRYAAEHFRAPQPKEPAGRKDE